MDSKENKLSSPQGVVENHHSSAEVKHRIVEVASKLFAEKSYEGASVRDIASHCGVNVAMISYYFGSKEGLYLECIATFAKGRFEVIQKILMPAENKEEFKVRLKLFFETMMALYASDKHLLRIIIRESQAERGEAFHQKVMTHMHPVFLLVQNYYETAIKNGVLKKDTHAQLLATMTMAVMSHPCIMEKAVVATCGQNVESHEYQSQYIHQICETFFFGVLA